MKSKANIKSHPLHPILVVFPIAFFVGTLLFDLLGSIEHNDSLLVTSENLNIAGIISALLAAIPGIIDYVYTVPPKSSGNKRAMQHGLINVSVIILFSVALWYRRSDNQIIGIGIGLEIVGIILLSIAGWLGGTLVSRNQIGIDIRYANASKWSEAYSTDTGRSIMACTTNELQLNQMKLIHVQGKRIVICKTENGYSAFDDRCTHKGGSLAGGTLICGTVQCPWHGSQFDVKTGGAIAGPAKENICTYNVNEKDGVLFIGL